MSGDNDLYLWTVYQNPKDYPGQYVARRFVIRFNGGVPTNQVIVSDNLETLQASLENKGLTKLARNDADEPHIIESWI